MALEMRIKLLMRVVYLPTLLWLTETVTTLPPVHFQVLQRLSL